MILPEVANKLWNTAAVSCASINFCLATGGNDVAIYNGKTWSSQSIVTDGELADVSCVNPSYCMAADEEQVIQFYNGTSWSAQTSGPTDPEAVSCPSIDFCEAGNSVFMSEYNGTSWSKPTSVDFAGNFDLSCASRSFCVVVDDGEAIVGTR